MKIKFNDIPKTTQLFQDYLYNFERVQEFYRFAPFEEIEFTIQFDRLKKQEYHRDKIAGILIEQNKKYGASETTLRAIERFRDPNTFVVFTGQQIGLFGGPLYTIYKALTAVNLSLHLTLHTPYHVLPFFWVEGEDHDFDEIKDAYIIDKDNQLLQLQYNPDEPFRGQPVGDMIIDDTINGVIDMFASHTHDTEFKEEIISSLCECYRPGRSLADAFASWMTFLTTKHGLIMVDTSDPRLKEMALPVYLKSLDLHRDEINRELTRVNERLLKKGYHNQVSHRMDVLDFFYHDPRRLPFIRENDRYHLKDSDLSFSRDQLREFIINNVKDFSPNVMLRPQVQDYLFPTAAYVAGPSETAYFAQFKGIYDIFQTPMPVIYPRRSVTVLEKRIQSLMKKYDITFSDVLTDKRDLEMKVARKSYPQSLTDCMEDTRSTIMKKLGELEREASSFNPNLQPIIKKLEGRVEREFASTETRIVHEIEKKDHIMKGQIDRVYLNLFPDQHLQERRLNILNFLYKYGHKIIDAFRCISCLEHEAHHRLWELNLDNKVCTTCFKIV